MTQKKVETGLELRRNQFRKALIHAAAEENREIFKKQLLGHVQEILMQIQKQRDYILNAENNVKILKAKIRAIENNEITVDNYGAITFKDVEVQRGVVFMKECKNCGYPQNR